MAKEKTQDAAAEAAPASTAVKMPMLPMLISVVLAAMLAVGGAAGAVYWLARSGRLPLQGGPQKVEAATVAPKLKHLFAIDPLLVNLADEGGRCYLRVTLTLDVEDEPLPKGAKPTEEKAAKGKPVFEHDAEVRDAAFGAIGSQTTTQLLAPDGKENLKALLLQAFAKRVPGMKVNDIYLTEFLVQR